MGIMKYEFESLITEQNKNIYLPFLKDNSLCEDCPIKQIIWNCYHSKCNVYKCNGKLLEIFCNYSEDDWVEYIEDRNESLEILSEMLNEMDKKK